MKEKEKFGKFDIIVWIGVLVVALCLFVLYQWKSEDGEVVQVRVNGKIQAEYTMKEPGTYEIKGINHGKNILVIEDGKARIQEADCPDGLCIKQGNIYKVGDSLICLPHKVVVEVIRKQNKASDDMDAVAK